jgi:hypothetical protein
MERHFCDKCGKIIYRNNISGNFNKVCFMKDSFQVNKPYKEDEFISFELCDYCYNTYFDLLNKISSEGEFVSRMTDSIRSNFLYPRYTNDFNIWKDGLMQKNANLKEENNIL